MENKPLKRNTHILQLSKEHHFTLLFCWKIRQGLKLGVEAERMKNYVHYFWQQDMQEHFREEETLLFAPVAQDEKVQRAIEEHRQIKQQIDSLSHTSENVLAQLSALADAVDRHVRYEERELFPYLEKILTTAQLELIGAQLGQGEAAKDNYTDEFWIKAK